MIGQVVGRKDLGQGRPDRLAVEGTLGTVVVIAIPVAVSAKGDIKAAQLRHAGRVVKNRGRIVGSRHKSIPSRGGEGILIRHREPDCKGRGRSCRSKAKQDGR